jgi:phage terminase large subunit-like protein
VKVLESVITGEVVDDTWFAFIAAVDRDKDMPCFKCKGENCPWCGGNGLLPVDDPYDEKCWIKANPGLGITPKLERMRETANEAKHRPDKEAEFFQKNLNIVVSSKERFIQPEVWGGGTELSDRTYHPGHGGIDLGRSDDLASIGACWQFDEIDDNGEEFRRYEIESKSWTVTDRPEHLRTTNISRWIAEGRLFAHTGDQVDFTLIRDEVLDWHQRYVLRTWAYDPTFAKQMAQELTTEGLQMFPFTQAPKYYTEPIREFRKLLGKSRKVDGVDVPLLKHNGCPVLAWQAGNLIIDRNTRGEHMPDKQSTENKIDAMVALLMAFSECLYHGKEVESVYETPGSLLL